MSKVHPPVVYGISNCDTVRNARRWLKTAGVAHQFHDFRRDGLERAQLQGWVDALGWQNLLNRRGMSWRKLPPAEREGLDEAGAIALMLKNPTLIRRPVLACGEHVINGFDPDQWARLLRV